MLAATLLAVAADKPDSKTGSGSREVLDTLRQRMSEAAPVYLEFSQERQLRLFAEPLKSEGVMMVDEPDRIRWETTSPYESILVGNQKSVAQYERVAGQWRKLNTGFPQMLRRVMEQMTWMHQGKLDALTRDFDLTVAAGSAATVTMVPKAENIRSIIASIEAKFAPDLSALREVVIHEPGGDLTRIVFRAERRQAKIPAGAFDQAKPMELPEIRKALGGGP